MASSQHIFRASLRLPPLPSSGDLLRLYKIKAAKKLSQNFLLDSKLRSKVVSSATGIKGSYIIEVGPGPGNLTRCMFEQGAEHVNVVEKDTRFLPALEILKDATQDRLGIYLGDVLNYDMKNLLPKQFAKPWEDSPPNFHIIGNLPFSISTPLIIHWIKNISNHDNAWIHGRVPMTLTFQEEVAERMVAKSSTFQRCRMSIMCQNWCHIKHLFTIPGRAFVPKPNVNVAVVKFVPKLTPSIDLDFNIIEKVVLCTFSMRQKICKTPIGTLFPRHCRKAYVDQLLKVSDVDPTKKSYQLTFLDFSRLCHAYDAMVKETPKLLKYNHRLQDSEANYSDVQLFT